MNQSKVMEEILQHKWNLDVKNYLKTTGRIIDDDGSESEEDIEPWIADF